MARGRKVFLCYRREDSAGITGRLKDRLEGAGFTAFMDTEDISSGTDWTIALRQAVTGSDVLVAMIGPTWLTSHDLDGRRRLDSPTDHVVDEIATALDYRVRTIPVLIDGTPMPGPNVLPPRLTRLANMQALPLRHNSFGADAERLMNEMDPGRRTAATAPSAAPVAPAGSPPTGDGGSVRTPRTPTATKRASRPKVEFVSRKAKIITIGVAALALVIAITVLVVTLTGPPRFDAQGLGQHIPAPIRDKCQAFTPPEVPLQINLRVALTCQPDGDGAPQKADYLHYDSLASTNAAYNSQLPGRSEESDCTRQQGQRRYAPRTAPDGSKHQGTLACFPGPNSTTLFMWTDESLDVVVMARFPPGQSYERNLKWWTDYLGPV